MLGIVAIGTFALTSLTKISILRRYCPENQPWSRGSSSSRTFYLFSSLRVNQCPPFPGDACPFVAACLPFCFCGPRLGADMCKYGKGAQFSLSPSSSAPDVSFHLRVVVSRQLGVWLSGLHPPCVPGLWLGRWCSALRWRYRRNISNVFRFLPSLAAKQTCLRC